MNKLLIVTVLVALLALSAESSSLHMQADEEVEPGTVSKISDTVKSYYDNVVDTASGYVESIRGLKIEEKAKNLYDDTTKVVGTYAGIVQDQLYYWFYQHQ